MKAQQSKAKTYTLVNSHVNFSSRLPTKKKEKSKIKNKKNQPVTPLPMKGRYRPTEKSLRLLLSSTARPALHLL